MHTSEKWVGAVLELHLQTTETRLSGLDIKHHKLNRLRGPEHIAACDQRNKRIANLPRSAGNQHLERSFACWALARCLNFSKIFREYNINNQRAFI